MSKVKKAVKSVASFVNDIVPNEIKPVVKIGLAMIPGVGPALSAAYTAADAYGGGASLGNALGQGAKSFAISQVAGAASRALGLTTQGNDLTDALGQTKGEGIFGLGSGPTSAAQTLGSTATVAAAPITPVSVSDLPPIDKAASAASTAAATAPASSSLFSFDNLTKGAALAGGVATAASMLTKPAATTMPSASGTSSNDNTAAMLSDNAALAADEELRRKRRGASSNIYTSPLGLGNGQSAAAQLLG